MKIIIANPHGFCSGVKRAINIVNKTLKNYNSPIYIRHEIVHNKYVVNSLKKRGVIFIEELSEVPDNSILIFSAHGTSKVIHKEASFRNFNMLLDATCPLVTKIHMKVAKASDECKEVILIGHKEHQEIKGTIGYYTNNDGGIYIVESKEDVSKLKIKNKNNLCFVTQTTFSVNEANKIINELIKRFPKIIMPNKNDICYATKNRQEAAKKLAKISDIIFIIGSKNSSNSNRLLELILKTKKPAYLIEDDKDIKNNWLINKNIVGLTSGASTPDVLIYKVIYKLKKFGVSFIDNLKK